MTSCQFQLLQSVSHLVINTTESHVSMICNGGAEVSVAPRIISGLTEKQGTGKVMRTFGCTLVGKDTAFDSEIEPEDEIIFENKGKEVQTKVSMVSSANTLVLVETITPAVSKASSYRIRKTEGRVFPAQEDRSSFVFKCSALEMEQTVTTDAIEVDVGQRVLRWGRLQVAFPSWAMLLELLESLGIATARSVSLSEDDLCGLVVRSTTEVVSTEEFKSHRLLTSRVAMSESELQEIQSRDVKTTVHVESTRRKSITETAKVMNDIVAARHSSIPDDDPQSSIDVLNIAQTRTKMRDEDSPDDRPPPTQQLPPAPEVPSLVTPVPHRTSTFDAVDGTGLIMRTFGATLVGKDTLFDQEIEPEDEIIFENKGRLIETKVSMVSSANTLVLAEIITPAVSKASSYRIRKMQGLRVEETAEKFVDEAVEKSVEEAVEKPVETPANKTETLGAKAAAPEPRLQRADYAIKSVPQRSEAPAPPLSPPKPVHLVQQMVGSVPFSPQPDLQWSQHGVGSSPSPPTGLQPTLQWSQHGVGSSPSAPSSSQPNLQWSQHTVESFPGPSPGWQFNNHMIGQPVGNATSPRAEWRGYAGGQHGLEWSHHVAPSCQSSSQSPQRSPEWHKQTECNISPGYPQPANVAAPDEQVFVFSPAQGLQHGLQHSDLQASWQPLSPHCSPLHGASAVPKADWRQYRDMKDDWRRYVNNGPPLIHPASNGHLGAGMPHYTTIQSAGGGVPHYTTIQSAGGGVPHYTTQSTIPAIGPGVPPPSSSIDVHATVSPVPSPSQFTTVSSTAHLVYAVPPQEVIPIPPQRAGQLIATQQIVPQAGPGPGSNAYTAVINGQLYHINPVEGAH